MSDGFRFGKLTTLGGLVRCQECLQVIREEDGPHDCPEPNPPITIERMHDSDPSLGADAHPERIWTRDLPSVSGYYWTRLAVDEEDVSIRHVSVRPDGSIDYVEDADYMIEPDRIGWWAGPLPEPTDAR